LSTERRQDFGFGSLEENIERRSRNWKMLFVDFETKEVFP
jgi:hypothetical protein